MSSEITRTSDLGLKVKSPYTQELIHGSIVSFRPERRTEATGQYGVFDVIGGTPAMYWPGLNAGFGIDVEEKYEEIQHNPVHANIGNVLEEIRNSKVGEELAFSINVHPQVTAHFPLLRFITGSATGLGDQPDSTSWLKELNGVYSLYTGIMFDDYKCEIPGIGVAKEAITGFAGHRVAVTSTSPVANDDEADENLSNPVTWADIQEIRMDPSDVPDPTSPIYDCISDIAYGFTSDVKKEKHPESTLSTKTKNVRAVSRKMFVTLKLGWASQNFLDIVADPQKKNLKLKIGTGDDAITMIFGGLYFPKYVAKAEAKNLVGDSVTCIVDQPTFSFSAAT